MFVALKSKRSLFVFLFFVVTTVIAIYFVVNHLYSKNKNDKINAYSVAESTPHLSSVNVAAESTNSSTTVENTNAVNAPQSKHDALSDTDIELRLAGLPTPEDMAKGAELMKKWGYFSDKDKEVYNTYDEKTLQELGDNGDLLALTVLMERSMMNFNVESLEKTFAAIEKAAVYGSTPALRNRAIAVPVSMYEEGSEGYRAAMRESLALYEVGLIRGDPRFRGYIREKLRDTSYKISDEDQALIDLRAKEIYDHLTQKRKALGLGGFDNSMPEGLDLDNYFDFFNE